MQLVEGLSRIGTRIQVTLYRSDEKKNVTEKLEEFLNETPCDPLIILTEHGMPENFLPHELGDEHDNEQSQPQKYDLLGLHEAHGLFFQARKKHTAMPKK